MKLKLRNFYYMFEHKALRLNKVTLETKSKHPNERKEKKIGRH